MTVVAAGVHLPRMQARAGERVLLGHRQSINIGAHADRMLATAVFDDADDTCFT
jgi:hypothetical protein